jgi:UDP-N-acetylglucosamine 4,6-dehydratase
MRAALCGDPRLRWFIGDVRDSVRLAWAVQGSDMVVHAAALKRVETCEENPSEAVATNIIGTGNVAEAAIAHGVARAVFLSTDKAPAPHTLYGATKLCAERLWIQSNVYAAGKPTRLSATRYGNVLGSTGSVLDTWRGQASRGEPLTITDASMTRFWMTIEDAVDLVCTALREMRGGEVFVPKCGSAPIINLARVIAPTATVRNVGLRPGERIHETLISAEESRTTRDAGTHYVIEPEAPTWTDERRALASARIIPTGWSFRSDTNNRQLSAGDLARMIA